MDRAFLDANVLVCAAHHARAGLRKLWNLPDVKLTTSTFAVEEARRFLVKRDQRSILSNLLDATELFKDFVFVEADETIPRSTAERLRSGDFVIVGGKPDRPLPKGVWLPEKDRPILFAAMDTGSTHLLTVDTDDFGRYFGRTIEGVLVVHAPAYLRERGC